MIILVSGSREGFTYEDFVEGIDMLISHEGKVVSEIVVGCAKGIDYFARKFAKENNIKLSVFKANWDGLGKKAGILRNTEMIDYVSEKDDVFVIAFRFDMSRGTSDLIRKVKSIGLPIKIIEKSSFTFD